MAQLDAANSGYNPSASGPGADLERQWKFRLEGDTLAAPTVVDSTLFTAEGTHVHAVDLERGEEQWSTPLTRSVATFSPLVSGNRVYVGDTDGTDGTLYALDRQTGTIEWTIDGNPLPSPISFDGLVYYCENVDDDARARGIDESGEVRWEFAVPQTTARQIGAMPAVTDGIVYVTANSTAKTTRELTVYAVDIDTDDVLWQFDATGHSVAAPVVAEGAVYVSSLADQLYAIDTSTGTQRWAFSTEAGISTSPAVADGTVYVGDGHGTYYAIDADSGTVDWRTQTNTSPTPPATTDEYLYTGSDPILALKTNDGSVEWTYSEAGFYKTMYAPVVTGGALYFGICLKKEIVGLYDNYVYKFQ